MEEEITKINKKGKHSENLKEKKVKSKKKNFKNPEETKKRKKGKVIKIVLIVVLVIIIALGIVIGTFVNGKLSKINFQKLDENNLEINDNMYEETEGLSQKEYDQVINIMLLGSDSKDMNDTYGGNSDAMIIVSINPKYKSIKLISIPRDTAADIDGLDHRFKINYAFATGKEQLALKTVNTTFDLNLKEYVTINISSMYDIINELGGVEVNVTKDEMKWVNEYADMFYGFSGKPSQKLTKYGKVTLTGEQTASYVKERMSGTNYASSEHGDYGRTRRQRDVFISMLNKIASKDPSEISRILDLILSQVTTNIDVSKYTTMLPSFVANRNEYLNNITSVMLPALDYSKEIYENNAYLYVTDTEKAKKDFIKYMYQM
jgi:transcriptional regulator, lytR family